MSRGRDGGTSAGAPQWAALLAIANQGRALDGASTLDGRRQTLPSLYSLYSPPGTEGYSTTYAAAFHDIGNDGYGYTTGLGTPHAASVVATLVGNANGTGGNPTPSEPAPLPPSPLTVEFARAPAAGIGGETATARVRVTNSTADRFSGPVTLTLYASTDATQSSDDAVVTTVSLRRLTLKPGASKALSLKFTRPADLPDGSYEYLASAAATGTNTAAAEAATPDAIPIEAPTADLSVAFAGAKSNAATLTLTNEGNVTATGGVTLTLYASSDATLDPADAVLTTLPARTVRLRAGKTVKLHVRFDNAGVSAGGFLIASITPAVQPADANAANDVAAAPVV